MKIRVSNGNLINTVSMPPIRCIKIQGKKNITIRQISYNDWADEFHLIQEFERYPFALGRIILDLKKRENEIQTQCNESKKTIDDTFCPTTGIISRLNDQNAAYSGCINLNCNFLLIEEKEYVDYA